MCMPTSNVPGFGYSWGFASTADLTKGEVDTPNSLSYTLGNTVRTICIYFSCMVFLHIRFLKSIVRSKIDSYLYKMNYLTAFKMN